MTGKGGNDEGIELNRGRKKGYERKGKRKKRTREGGVWEKE